MPGKFFRHRAQKAGPTSQVSRENSKKTSTGKDTSALLTLFPPSSNFNGNFREFLLSLREYLNTNSPELTHLLDVGGLNKGKLTVLSIKKERKLSQTQLDVVKAKNRQTMTDNERIDVLASKTFQVILGNLSTESVRRIQEKVAEGIPSIPASGSVLATMDYVPKNWDDFLADRDVTHLWTAIRSTHIGCTVGIPVLDMIEYTIGMLTLIQENGQTPSQFQQVLEQMNSGLVNVGTGALKPLPEPIMAGILFRNLSRDYSEVQNYLVNQCLMGVLTFPKTTAEVLTVVEKYVSENKKVFLQQTSDSDILADSPLKRKLEQAEVDKKKLLKTVESLKSELASSNSNSKSTKNYSPKGSSSSTNSVIQPQKDAKPSRPCGHCGEMHYAFYCDKLTKEQRKDNLDKWMSSQKSKLSASKSDKSGGVKFHQSVKVLFTKSSYDDDDPLSEHFVRGDHASNSDLEPVDDDIGIAVERGNIDLFFTGEATDYIDGPPAECLEDSSDESINHDDLLAKVHTVLSTGDPEFDKIISNSIEHNSTAELRCMLKTAYTATIPKNERLCAISRAYPDCLILDPGSQVSIAKDKFYVNNIRTCRQVRINNERKISQVGTNAIFGDMLYDPTFIANLLSMSEILDRGMDVAWISARQVFIVSDPVSDRTIEFVRVGGLWVADSSSFIELQEYEVNFTSVDDRMKHFSNRANTQAKLAYDFMNARQLSVKDASTLVQSIVGSPLSAIDFKRADFIWGPAESLNSRHKTTKPEPIDVESHLSSITSVGVSVDLMFMHDMVFLVSQSTPLNIKQCTCLKSRRRPDLLLSLSKQLSLFKKYNRNVEILLSDGEGGIVALDKRVDELQGKLDDAPRINIEAAGSHVPYVENLIGYAKAKLRGFTNTSKLEEMPKALFALIVCAHVESLNYLPCSSNHQAISPWEALTQVRPTFDRYFKIAPGQFAWVVEPRPEVGYSRVDFDRMIPAIALNPTGSIRNAYKFFSLETGSLITRDKFEIGVVTDEIIMKIKSFDGDESYLTEQILESEDDVNFLQPSIPVHRFQSLNSVVQAINPNHQNQQVITNQFHPAIPDISLIPKQLLVGDIEISALNRSNLHQIKPPSLPMVTRSRSNFKFVHLTHAKAKKTLGDAVEIPVENEIYQLLVDKEVLLPSHFRDLSPEDIKNAVRTHMLVDEKYHQNGLLDKIKARLVALGCHENPETIGESFAPTPFMQHIFSLCAIAAKEKCKIRTLDISGAFLNASYLHKRQFVILNKQLADVICKIQPQYQSCRRSDGSMYCRLKKALYGLTEAGKLWNDEMTRVMIGAGFKPSFIDPCVFTKIFDGVLCTVVVHVDDFKIMSTSDSALDFVENLMREKFKKITVKNGLIHEFLGMLFDYSEVGFVNITQAKFIKDIISNAGVSTESSNPALPNLFFVNENSHLLQESERKRFHTIICKAQYLAKRTRPDILPAVHFLSRRVNQLTEDDKQKMLKVAEYLVSTQHQGIRLSAATNLRVIVYIDASYATHNDRKSHTGVCVTLGCGMVYCSSKRQKINTKSACEAELVGLSDGLGIPIQLQNFLLSIGYKLPPILVMQDNTSTIQLAKNGRSYSDTTRHVETRYFWMHDRIKRGQIELKHTVTLAMIADILTKPVQGLLFFDLRNRLLGYELPNTS